MIVVELMWFISRDLVFAVMWRTEGVNLWTLNCVSAQVNGDIIIQIYRKYSSIFVLGYLLWSHRIGCVLGFILKKNSSLRPPIGNIGYAESKLYHWTGLSPVKRFVLLGPWGVFWRGTPPNGSQYCSLSLVNHYHCDSKLCWHRRVNSLVLSVLTIRDRTRA